jgi:hypothetical protein
MEAFVVDVLEPTGRYIGQVRLPDGMRQFEARGDTVWTVELDSYDVPYVKRYHINWERPDKPDGRPKDETLSLKGEPR